MRKCRKSRARAERLEPACSVLGLRGLTGETSKRHRPDSARLVAPSAGQVHFSSAGFTVRKQVSVTCTGSLKIQLDEETKALGTRGAATPRSGDSKPSTEHSAAARALDKHTGPCFSRPPPSPVFLEVCEVQVSLLQSYRRVSAKCTAPAQTLVARTLNLTVSGTRGFCE